MATNHHTVGIKKKEKLYQTKREARLWTSLIVFLSDSENLFKLLREQLQQPPQREQPPQQP